MAKKHIATRKLKKEISFTLEGSEIEGLGILLAKQLTSKAATERAFSAVKKDWSGKIEAQELEIIQTTKMIEDRQRTEIVMVEERRVFKKRLVEYWYKGKMVEVRDMTPEEMQTEMPLESKDYEPEDSIAEVIKSETKKKTKSSALDARTN